MFRAVTASFGASPGIAEQASDVGSVQRGEVAGSSTVFSSHQQNRSTAWRRLVRTEVLKAIESLHERPIGEANGRS